MDILAEVFEILSPLAEVPLSSKDRNLRVSLCHYAMEVWNRSHHGAIMLHGHTHGRLPENSQRLDVGVDCWGFSPVRLEDVLGRLRMLPEYPLGKTRQRAS